MKTCTFWMFDVWIVYMVTLLCLSSVSYGGYGITKTTNKTTKKCLNSCPCVSCWNTETHSVTQTSAETSPLLSSSPLQKGFRKSQTSSSCQPYPQCFYASHPLPLSTVDKSNMNLLTQNPYCRVSNQAAWFWAWHLTHNRSHGEKRDICINNSFQALLKYLW